MIDILANLYVLSRLMQILKNNSRLDPPNMTKIVIYWNLLTIMTAVLYQISMTLNIVENKVSIMQIATQSVLSYLVTIDTEIKVVKRRNKFDI